MLASQGDGTPEKPPWEPFLPASLLRDLFCYYSCSVPLVPRRSSPENRSLPWHPGVHPSSKATRGSSSWSFCSRSSPRVPAAVRVVFVFPGRQKCSMYLHLEQLWLAVFGSTGKKQKTGMGNQTHGERWQFDLTSTCEIVVRVSWHGWAKPRRRGRAVVEKLEVQGLLPVIFTGPISARHWGHSTQAKTGKALIRAMCLCLSPPTVHTPFLSKHTSTSAAAATQLHIHVGRQRAVP